MQQSKGSYSSVMTRQQKHAAPADFVYFSKSQSLVSLTSCRSLKMPSDDFFFFLIIVMRRKNTFRNNIHYKQWDKEGYITLCKFIAKTHTEKESIELQFTYISKPFLKIT